MSMPLDKALQFWIRWKTAEKLNALRIAGHMNGVDVDAEVAKKTEEDMIATCETSYDTLGMFFGVDLS